ncbi:MAG: thioredoxin domain-containing protein [Candidatus Hatepunaea meridiana]|nr:thioredoxin domain-containing protein [Candidatus Hatepunaea meridiana]
MPSMIKIGDTEFDNEVIDSDRLTLVDFGAEWCGPCKKLHPVMENIATEYGDKIKVCEVDIGVSPQTGLRFGITSVPQLLFFRDGIVKESVIGLLPKSKIEEKIDQYLSE